MDKDSRLAAGCARNIQRILGKKAAAEGIEVSEREKILGRIREALKVQAPFPGHGHSSGQSRTTGTPAQNARRWLPHVGETFQERLELFRKNSSELKADFFFEPDLEALAR